MTGYVYWAIRCKTPGCENNILLYCTGPQGQSDPPVLGGPESIEVKCMSCRQTHSYRRDEIHTKLGSAPPSDFVPHPLIRSMSQPST
jgi:hypothetical protein